MLEFPKDFLWGAATSAYQVEGNNDNCDWWEWEKRYGLKDTSGSACRSYELFTQDFDIAHRLHHNAHRLSVEWSRIEPQEGVFSEEEISHYQEVVRALRERKIIPVVTLHHFTNPLWFSRRGGWQDAKACFYFVRFVEKIVEALSDQVRYWVTINEPMVYVYQSYVLGLWPPQEKSFSLARGVTTKLLNAHVQAYQAIHRLYEQKQSGPVFVGIAKNMQAFVPCISTAVNRCAAAVRDYLYNYELLLKIKKRKAMDFIGVNYYTRNLVEVRGGGMGHFLLDICQEEHSHLPRNTLGWDIYPEGFFQILMKLKSFNLPVFILENGICTLDDAQRWDFVLSHLQSLHRAISEGVPVLGYLYWSLLDNYEWDKGFAPRFGLVEVDYKTQQRTIRESALKFAEVCHTGKVVSL
ncbi:MAG: glycoside hydrolase family 1 protein [Candidatus Omnitrophica bacterium]|nr:glycoside hydrolase family 1 protein [Candidatus Omnitrophota bacterium]